MGRQHSTPDVPDRLRPTRILFIADHDLWPTDSGLVQRLHHLAAGLARRHEVTLIIMSPTGEVAPFPNHEVFSAIRVVPYSSCNFRIDEAAGRAPSPLRSLAYAAVHRTPAVVQRFSSELLAETVRELVDLARIEVVWASRAHFAEQVRSVTDVPVVVDLADLEGEAYRRVLATRRGIRLRERLELGRLSRWEAGLTGRFAAVAVCKPTDLDWAGPGLPHLVRNGFVAAPVTDPRDERSDEVLFVGNLEYGPNVDAVRWFHDDVLPLVRARRPSTRFVVVGRQPRPEITALHDGDGCIVHVGVADLDPWYSRAGIVVVPMRLGSGTRVKSLEAMARRKCLVSTSIGVEGIDVRDGVEFAGGDTAEELAEACVALLGDPARRRALAAAAHARVTDAYSWSIAVEEAERVVAVARRNRSSAA